MHIKSSDKFSRNNRFRELDQELLFSISDFFKVFSDPTRVKILFTLLNGELCVGELVKIMNMNQSAISHQLRTLRQNNIVKFRKEGKTVYYSLDDSHVEEILTQSFIHLSHKNN